MLGPDAHRERLLTEPLGRVMPYYVGIAHGYKGPYQLGGEHGNPSLTI